MIHLGDICKLNGAEIPPVDVITFGSPCQDLSIAGTRSGLDGDRSGLFKQAIRVIREMREATNGRYPTFAVFENVPGIYSSNGGEDWRTAMEMFCNLGQRGVTVPRLAKRNGQPDKWRKAGLIVCDGWSFAYRTIDAQYFGVAQRRVRCAAVLDLGGNRAGKILFESTGVSGDPEQGGQEGEGTPGGAEDCP